MFSQNELCNQNNYPNVVYLLIADKPRRFSKALVAASASLCKGNGNADVQEVFAEVLCRIAKEKRANASCATPPTFFLQAEVAEEYNPCFFHLRHDKHRHAMEAVTWA